jgi:intein/homing endonuclease
MKPGPAGYTDEITMPGEEVYCRCVSPDSKVEYADGIEIVHRRWYEGEVIRVNSFDSQLDITPNHPVLTPKGWIAAGLLKKGDYIVKAVHKSDALVKSNDINKRPPTIDEIFSALSVEGSMQSIFGASSQFHGDGSEGEVDIVWANRPLSFNFVSTPLQSAQQFSFSNANNARAGLRLFQSSLQRIIRPRLFQLFANLRSLFTGIIRPAIFGSLRTFNVGRVFEFSFVHGSNDHSAFFNGISSPTSALAIRYGTTFPIFLNFLSNYRSFFRSFRRPVELFGFRSRPHDTSFSNTGSNESVVDVDYFADFPRRFPFEVELDRVISVERYAWRGHVYNLKTNDGWYVANNCIVSNCFYQYIYNLNALPAAMLTVKGQKAMAALDNIAGEAAA